MVYEAQYGKNPSNAETAEIRKTIVQACKSNSSFSTGNGQLDLKLSLDKVLTKVCFKGSSFEKGAGKPIENLASMTQYVDKQCDRLTFQEKTSFVTQKSLTI